MRVNRFHQFLCATIDVLTVRSPVSLRHHGIDSIHLRLGCGDSGERLRDISDPVSQVPSDLEDDPDGPTRRNLETAGLSGLCSQQGNQVRDRTSSGFKC